MKLLFLVAFALFALGADPAHADPVGSIALFLFNKVGLGTALGATLGAKLSFTIARIVVGIGASVLSSALQRAFGGGNQSGVELTVETGDDTPLSFTLGKYATAGKRKYIGTWGKNNKYITEVIEYSALPQGLSKLWVNDELATINWGSTNTVNASVLSGWQNVETERQGEVRTGQYTTKTVNLGQLGICRVHR